MSTGLRPSTGMRPSNSSSAQRGARPVGQRQFVATPREPRDVVAQRADRVGIVLGEVLGEPRDRGVHQRAAEFLLGRDLAGGGLEQRRPGEERAGAVAHHHDEVGQARHVGAARRRAAVHDREHRDAGGREPRQPRVVRTAEDEVLDAVAQQVGAGRFDEVHERQPVLERELLRALEFLEPHRLQRAGLDARVVDDDHAVRAADHADAGQQPAARHGLLRVGHVEQVARAGRQLQPRSARVEQQREPLARQQLAALREPRARRGSRQSPHGRAARRAARSARACARGSRRRRRWR